MKIITTICSLLASAGLSLAIPFTFPEDTIAYTFDGVLNHTQSSGPYDLHNGLKFTGYLLLFPSYGIIYDTVSTLSVFFENQVFLSSNYGFAAVQDSDNSRSLEGLAAIIWDGGFPIVYDTLDHFGLRFNDPKFWSDHDLLGSVGILDQVKHWSLFADVERAAFADRPAFSFTLNGKITHVNGQPVPDAGSSAVLLGMAFAGLLGLRRLQA
jgi:hypothetical protein